MSDGEEFIAVNLRGYGSVVHLCALKTHDLSHLLQGVNASQGDFFLAV